MSKSGPFLRGIYKPIVIWYYHFRFLKNAYTLQNAAKVYFSDLIFRKCPNLQFITLVHA
jgi:hypothetical protein